MTISTMMSFVFLLLPYTLHAKAMSVAIITMSQPIISDQEGNSLIQAARESQIALSTTVFNNILQSQPYVAIIEIRDESGITESLAWSSGVLRAESNRTIGISFIPHEAVTYTVRAFAITDLEQPMVLSPVAQSEINVGSEKKIERVTMFEDYPLPTVEILRNYTRMDASELQRRLCVETTEERFDVNSLAEGDPNATKWLPQKLTFENLVPKLTLYRIGCSIDSHGIQYAHYIMHNNAPTFVSDFKGLFQPITSDKQALEYVAYFWLAHGEKGIRTIIPSEPQFESATVGCVLEKNPPFRNIRIIEKSGFYMIGINIFDRDTGAIYHLEWKVPFSSDGVVYADSGFKVGQCNVSD
ncbi:MAG TPA: hypothetical protein VJP79_04075 [Nitrososphaera sp.]|nr:hypothetical protein [Nitrososphaera sp.]